MPNKKERDYSAGFEKTPRHTRFQPGQSGNPKGRPKGSRNVATLLMQALDEPVTVRVNGRRRSITKLKAVVTQLVNKLHRATLAPYNFYSTKLGTSNAAIPHISRRRVNHRDLR